jgi:DNA-binding LacI/PurR family transcriptional regulator
MTARRKLIAIAYDLNFRHAAEIFSGVTEFTRKTEKNWQLLPLSYGFEAKLMELIHAGQLAGAIGTFVSDEWLNGITSRGVACINLFNLSQIISVPSVGLDEADLGKTAAEHLLEQGAQSFAFIGQNEAYFNKLRRRGLRDSLADARFVEIHPREPRLKQLETLAAEPRPVGLLCASDRIAREIAQLAPERGLQCGKDLLLIGIGNEPSESTFAGIDLSSFEIPAREIGYLAASLLAESLASGEARPQGSIQLKATLIPRESTLPSARARTAERTKNLLVDSIADPELSIDRIAERVGTSRRSLELTLKQQIGTSPYQLISKYRLEKAQELLRESSLPVGEIGARCGYPEPHHFSAWFKKKTGIAPKVYRLRKENQMRPSTGR